ncbi:VWA domain-containing protein [Nocardiopsis salina]|uniref:VWA domain-containing protein n=1 Tax=Nocardiopsis salina TaxID=245836 RepID=UPI000349E61C|nr:VWA domain-containing protein [Nocardiopsis salina]
MSNEIAERARRWRLVLGEDGPDAPLDPADRGMDSALAELYDRSGVDGAGERSGGMGDSAPRVNRWLGDIRTYFPSSVVRVMQKDAMDRLGLQRMLLEPELMEAVEADVHLVGTLLSLNSVMPDSARESARTVVRRVVDDLEKRLAQRTRSLVQGAIDRSARTHRPRRGADIDWNATIRRNLAHYLPEHRTLVPRTLVGHGRRSPGTHKDVVLAVDQSASMAESVVYASVFGAALASMRSVRTFLVAFDTAVADLTEHLTDPVEVLFGTQLGGGTDINRAISYCQGLITRPKESLFVLVSDLYEGGVREQMLRRVAHMKAAGTQVVVLLALSDEGAPFYDQGNAAALADLGVPAFACTPDAFPELMATALEGGPLTARTETAAP